MHADGIGLGDGHGGTSAEVPVGNRPSEQDGAGVVPVVFRLDDFSARRGDEFSEVHFEAFGLGWLDAEERLLDVVELVGGGRVGRNRIDQGIDAAVDDVDMRTDRIRIVVQCQARFAEVELIGLVVEIVEIVCLAIVRGGGSVEVVAVVAVDEAADVHWSDAPCWRWGRSRGSGGLSGGGRRDDQHREQARAGRHRPREREPGWHQGQFVLQRRRR